MSRATAVALGAVAAALAISPGRVAPATWLVVAALLALGASLRLARRSGGLELVAGSLAAAAIVVRLAGGTPDATAPRPPEGDGPWRAVVEGIAAPRRGQQPATLRLATDGIRVAATLPRFPAIKPGDSVVVTGNIRPPPDDDYGEYLRRTAVAGTLQSRTLDVEPREPTPVDLETLRRQAEAALTRAIPEPEAGLAAGILIGLRDRVDRDLAADFTTVGASHVVAISGWNIAIVAASVAALAGRLARRRRAVLTVAAIVAYVAFVGPTASVVRAAAMAGVVLLARESGRAGRAAAALGWAAAILLFVDPGFVRDAGFQLSALATAGLVRWGTPLTERLDRIGGGRLPGWLTESLGVSLAAQAATLPVVLASFGRLALISPLVNLLVVPLVAPAMAAGAIALVSGLAVLLPGVPAAVATIGGLPAWAALAGIVGVVRAGATVPFASVDLGPPIDQLAAAAIAVPLVVIAFRPGAVRRTLAAIGRALGSSRRALRAPSAPHAKKHAVPLAPTKLLRLAALALAGAALSAGIAFAHRPDGRTTVTVLDVGQGDAILVEGSRGTRLLVDGGPDPDRLLVALDERLPPWDRRIDVIVLSHPHEDHVAGLALLLERYRVARVFEPGMRGPGPGYAAWAARLATLGLPSGRLAAGDRLTIDDLRLDVLWPDPGTVQLEPPDTGTGINNVSIVLLGEVEGRRFLLTGDVEQDIDPALLARDLPRLDFLKVAHHGSGTASTDAFLEAIHPSIAVVSAGAGNPYGHPSPKTIERLRAAGATVLRTDVDGTVEVAIDAGGVSVRASGTRRTASLRPLRPALTANPFSCGIPVAPPPLLARLPSPG
ncbi:MAG TPA: ComEC/Rec2 family competence protein [Candidatus Limnocylindrales bacterium]